MRIFKNRIFIGVLSLVLAVVIGFVVVPAYTNIATTTITVVTAAKDISCGVQITEDMLAETEISKIGLPAGVAVKKEDVVGMYATDNIYTGYYITTKTVASELVKPETKIRNMKNDENVVPVPIGGTINAETKLLPNDIVSIYSIDKKTGQATIIPELSYVSVLACTTENGTNILYDGQKAADGSALSPVNINFILNRTQSLKLLSEMSTKTLYVLLTYRGTNQIVIDSYLRMQDSILQTGASGAQAATTTNVATQN